MSSTNLRASATAASLRASITRLGTGGSAATTASDSPTTSSASDPIKPIKPSRGVDILSQALSTTTDLIFGIYAVEMWHYDESTGKLHPVILDGGDDDEETGGRTGSLLLKRRTQESDEGSAHHAPSATFALGRLTDRSRPDHVPASPTDPGVGLPGVLWSESSSPSASSGIGGAAHNLGGMIRNGAHHLPGHHQSGRNVLAGAGAAGSSQDGVQWRDVGELADDPDQVSAPIQECVTNASSRGRVVCSNFDVFPPRIQPYDERLQTFAKAGFKLAAGIPFDVSRF